MFAADGDLTETSTETDAGFGVAEYVFGTRRASVRETGSYDGWRAHMKQAISLRFIVSSTAVADGNCSS